MASAYPNLTFLSTTRKLDDPLLCQHKLFFENILYYIIYLFLRRRFPPPPFLPRHKTANLQDKINKTSKIKLV